jgi:TolA-binding protein
MMNRLSSDRHGRAALIAVLASVWAGIARADTRDLERVGTELGSLGLSLEAMTKQYTDPSVLGPSRSFSERLTNGEILYLLNDFPRASLVLYDLVTDRDNQRDPLYPRALYYLAESLYQIGHDFSARGFFQELVVRRDPQHTRAAVRRLIQIADRTRHWEGIEEQIAALGAAALPADVAYIQAKSLLRQGKLEQAVTMARSIPRDDFLAPKAAYLIAVATVKLGDFEGARQQFDALVKTRDAVPDAARIRDLAAMNRGRIFLEEGKLTESMDAYQFVERKSPLFEEALYEVTWTYVRAADSSTDEEVKEREYKRAQNAIEILLLSEAENPVAPEARLLLANIMLRLGHYEEATSVFSEVVKRYGPVRDALRDLAHQSIDPAKYFEEVVGDSKHAGPQMLPLLALHWAREQHDLKEALSVASSLGEGEASLKETDALITKLLTILDSERRASFFPALTGAQSRALEYRNSLVAMSGRLLAVEREVVAGGLGDSQKALLKQVLAERAELEPQYLKLPQVKEDYEGRLSEMRQRMVTLQQQAYRLRYDVDSIRAQLAALRVWIGENHAMVPVDARQEYTDRIDQQDREVVEMESLHLALEERIARDKAMISITSEAEAQEDQLRARFAANLEREREILKTARVEDGGAPAVLREIERLRGLIGAHNSTLEQFERKLDHAVQVKSAGIKADLLKERGVLESYRQSIDGVRQDARAVVGAVAASSLHQVEDAFQGIVLRGDVGVVDVAWTLKELQTREISKKVNAQRHELQILDAEFVDILRED